MFITGHMVKRTGNLASNGSADLGLCVLEELNESRDHVPGDDLFMDSLGNLCWELVFWPGTNSPTQHGGPTFS